MLVLLACVEKLCSVMNFVAVEKDWVRPHPLLGVLTHTDDTD